ncbi:MAG: RNA methyltransferase [Saprospiraceae bacterium]|nr:RNA methyltransferase [Saprospiraceae bacterium]
MTPDREAKFKKVISARQNNLTVILENVHDPHNIGAVLRTCDSVGISEIFVLYNEASRNKDVQYVGINSASGAKKWVKVHFYDNTDVCVQDVRKRYQMLYGTHLATDSVSLYDLDLIQSVALVFGNENAGISDDMMKRLDGNFIIPQYGMVQSLNISVACAVTLFEASRQRINAGLYKSGFDSENPEHKQLFETYLAEHNPKSVKGNGI